MGGVGGAGRWRAKWRGRSGAGEDAGWTSCKKKVLKISYKCADLVSKRQYVTVGTLAMVYKGRTNTDTFSSKKVNVYCR
ncbi:hypothetical protein [Streptomyces sp. NPDC048248]|uniref:hypothetical protein n=1 Tax=Streptomyces sp. NPDC048248 TaxID=3365523 RepID=UPI00371D0759